MDIQTIMKMLEKELSSTKFVESFKKDPVKTVEKVIGVDLPDEQVKKAVDFVKAKLTADQVADVAKAATSLFNSLKK